MFKLVKIVSKFRCLFNGASASQIPTVVHAHAQRNANGRARFSVDVDSVHAELAWRRIRTRVSKT